MAFISGNLLAQGRSPQGSLSNGCCLFRQHHMNPFPCTSLFPHPLFVEWACATQPVPETVIISYYSSILTASIPEHTKKTSIKKGNQCQGRTAEPRQIGKLATRKRGCCRDIYKSITKGKTSATTRSGRDSLIV